MKLEIVLESRLNILKSNKVILSIIVMKVKISAAILGRVGQLIPKELRHNKI